MYCQHCGAEVAEGAQFCSSCGQTVAAAPAARRAPAPAVPSAPSTSAPAGPPPVSKLATLSLIVGLCGLCLWYAASLAGLILGIVALRKISASRGAVGGKGYAIAGIIVSAGLLALQLLIVVLMIPVSLRAREAARMETCQSNEKQLALGLIMYETDYDGHCAAAETWTDAIQPYLRNRELCHCPGLPESEQGGYVYNKALGMAEESDIRYPAETALVYDGTTGWNVSGGQESVVFRHNHGANLAYADGHVKWHPSGSLSDTRWELSESAPSPGFGSFFGPKMP